ncbi:Retrovirus-related Pol polyprotein from transposon RE1 [Vitis vinifera]|uniref:Retrovirus-related Pol polyprotein from transposon RE1 n=1 Tax=Vitis vinifera TaxID=29760 RepID=A0A438I2E1_VITVI|nr:Retrovirus-related Pol polyprotein from transposon RE1 [Vitis vinifera]
MSSTASQSSSSSGSAQSSSMVSIPSYQMLNYSLPVKLDRTNYILWRSQIDNVIFANGFEDFIDGTSVCPEKELRPGEINPAFVAWRRQDRTILSWIYSSLTPGIMAQIIGHNSSHSAWNALEKIFSSCSRARIMQLRLEFQSTKKGSMSMIDYIMKVKGVADSLAAIGESVSEQDQIMNLLGGLGSDYNAVVTAITIREDKISLEAVHSMLLAFEQRLEQQGSIEQLLVMSANYASSSNNRGGGRKYNGGRGPNFMMTNSNFRGRGRGGRYGQSGRQNSSSSERPQCQLCGKFGHTVQVCYHRFDITFQSTQNNTTGVSNSSNSNSMPAMVASFNNLADDNWYLDSGASHHLTQNVANLTNATPYTGADKVTIGNGSSYEGVLAQGKLENGLYKFPVISNKKTAYVGITNDSTFQCSTIGNKRELWHHRLGHAATDIVTRIMHNCNVSCGKYKATVCSSCQLAKSHRLPTHLSSFHASKPLELVYTDIWGPASVTSTSGAKYFILFVDDYSRYTWLYLLQSKDQALPIFKQFKLQVENQFDAKIKCLQSDNGGEFRSFMSFLQESGILHRFSCPYNSSQNGRVERKHRHVVETGLALLAHAGLPLKFWSYAFRQLHFSSTECLAKSCRMPLLTLPCSNEIQIISFFDLHHKGYLCLDNLTGRVYVSPHVVFDETQFPFAQNISSSPSKDASDESVIPAIIVSSNPSTLSFHGSNHSMASPNLTSALTHPTPPTDTPTTRSLREPVLEVRLLFLLNSRLLFLHHEVTTRSMSGITKRKHIFNLAAFKISEPTTLKQAIKDPNWAEAMQTEIAALHKNQTWDLVDPPKDVNIIGCKWVYKLKYKPDGSVDRYKARLVARGFNQTFGLDYFETFSPVVKAATIRIVLTIALSYRWELRQLDVQMPFSMKALYGLKQSSRAWFTKLSSALLSWGFNSSRTDSSMFVHFGRHSTLIVLVYVYDIIVTGSSPVLIQQLIHKLHSLFALRNLGQLSYFLGIEVTYDGGSMHLSQRKYITDLLQRTSMLDSKAVATPGTVGLSLSQFDGDLMDDVTMYRSVVGALQYATLTRPDIAFSVNKACQFMHRPTSTHWSSVKRILRSSSGYLVYLGNNLVSWTASKQKVVSRSSAESEYRGLAIATAEIIWTQALLSELCISITSIPTLYYDNISAYYMAKNPVFHARTKHIEIDLHFIRDQVLHNKLQLQYIPSTDQPADILTKHLTSSRFLSLRSHLCLVPRPFSLRGDDKPDVVIGSYKEEVLEDKGSF